MSPLQKCNEIPRSKPAGPNGPLAMVGISEKEL
jgi:hypothetical protein